MNFIDDKLAEFEEKWLDKGDERLGTSKHNNTVVRLQLDWLRTALEEAQQDALKNQPSPEEVRSAFEQATEQGRREGLKQAFKITADLADQDADCRCKEDEWDCGLSWNKALSNARAAIHVEIFSQPKTWKEARDVLNKIVSDDTVLSTVGNVCDVCGNIQDTEVCTTCHPSSDGTKRKGW